MDYQIDVKFGPIYELLNSLHTYICRKSYKKIDLAPQWAKETRQRLTPEFASFLDQTEIDGDWKLTSLLVHLCPGCGSTEDFLTWLEGLSSGDLYELISEYSNQFPDNKGKFRSRTLSMLSQWEEQYFRHIDPAIIESLRDETLDRKKALLGLEPEGFIDQTTNGLHFKPANGLQQLILIPQHHFQPLNVICNFGKLTLCHYSARIYFADDDYFPAPEYRMIRSLGEKNRLKILRYLHQGPRSFIEIVRHLNLSKGITHDHIAKLRSAGMIRAYFEGETLVEYTLRPGALEHMQRRLIAYIEQS